MREALDSSQACHVLGVLEMPAIAILTREKEIRRSEIKLATGRFELREILSQKKKMKKRKGRHKEGREGGRNGG